MIDDLASVVCISSLEGAVMKSLRSGLLRVLLQREGGLVSAEANTFFPAQNRPLTEWEF